MKFKTGFVLIIAAALLAASVTGLAEKGPQNRPQARPDRPAQQDRTYDQDRQQDRDRVDEKDQQKDQDRDQAKTKDQIQQKDRDIYGYQLMTEQERNEYRERVKTAETNQQREQILAEHREKMQARAKTNGVNLEENAESE